MPRAPVSPTPITIGPFTIGKGQPVFVAGEIGINAIGYTMVGRRLLHVIAMAGAQAGKFQKRTVDVVYSAEELAAPREVPREVLEHAIRRDVLPPENVERLVASNFAETTNGDLKWALEFSRSEYVELFDYATQCGLVPFASPWDLASVDFLEDLGVACHKVASACLTDLDLLARIRATGKPVVLSTGMSTLEEIDAAVEALGGPDAPLILLHCVATYPCSVGDIDLRVIDTLKERYPSAHIGYSGHETGLEPSLGAVARDASVIERHVTLDPGMYGSDQKASLSPPSFTELVQRIRVMEQALGTGTKTVLPSEVSVMKKLRRVPSIARSE